ncbi:MAG: hypothetical protein LUQ70_05375, partial [Methanobacteriaceae archaeon]|nr:hypothetical protein [Methanobacteriaceae archaeon]
EERIREIPDFSEKITSQRLEAHEDFLQKRAENGQSWKYQSSHYKFGVITRTEEDLHFPIAVKVKKTGENRYEVSYERVL